MGALADVPWEVRAEDGAPGTVVLRGVQESRLRGPRRLQKKENASLNLFVEVSAQDRDPDICLCCVHPVVLLLLG